MRATRLAIMAVAGLLSLASFEGAAAQTPQVLGPPKEGRVQRMRLRDGSELIGRITSVNDSTVQFEGSVGMSNIPRSMIVSVREEDAGNVHNGAYWFPSPNTTRLLFAPTGRTLKKGEGYFSDHWVFFPSLNFGISDNFSIGGGLSLIPGINPADQLWYVTPKLGLIQGPQINVAVGALIGRVPSDFESNSVGLFYGVGTFGTPDNSFTAGLTYGFEDGEISAMPSVMFGFETRMAPRVSLVSENYVFSGGFNLLSAGLRLFGVGGSFDFGAIMAPGETDGCCLPYLGVLFKF